MYLPFIRNDPLDDLFRGLIDYNLIAGVQRQHRIGSLLDMAYHFRVDDHLFTVQLCYADHILFLVLYVRPRERCTPATYEFTDYRFNANSSCKISSDVVIERALA